MSTARNDRVNNIMLAGSAHVEWFNTDGHMEICGFILIVKTAGLTGAQSRVKRETGDETQCNEKKLGEMR